jgi:probable phosphoglycerate mutase
MRLWLVRHGATDWSEQGRLCGWSDIPLSADGRGQAGPLRSRLDGLVFDGVWASDLARASEFACLVAGQAKTDSRLREIDFGELEGRCWVDCDRSTRDALVRFDGFVAPGGESVSRLEERVGEFISGLGPGEHLLFTHGGVIRLLTGRAGPVSYPAPGELTIIEWDGIDAE